MDPKDLLIQKKSSSMEIEPSTQSNPNDTIDNHENNPLFSELRIKRDARRTSEKMKEHSGSDFSENGARSQDSIGTSDTLSIQDSNSSNQDDGTNENSERTSLQLLSPPLQSSRRSNFQRRPFQNLISYLPPFNPPFRQENGLLGEIGGNNLPLNPIPNNNSALEAEQQNQNLHQSMETEATENNSPDEVVLHTLNGNNSGGLRNGVLIVRTVQPGPDNSTMVIMRIIPMSEVFGESEGNQEREETGFTGLFGMLLGLLTGFHEQRGLEKEVLDSLPVVKFDTESFKHVEPESKKCSICFENYEDGNEIKYLWCLHRFHKNCVDHWLEGHTNCPICKNDYSPVEKTDLP